MSNSKFRVGDYVEYHGAINDSPSDQVGLRAHVMCVDGDGDVKVNFGGVARLWAHENIRKIPNPLVTTKRALPTDSEERKTFPMFRGLLAYFPAALGQVSQHSFEGNEKHNPGKPMQHARGKSTDHKDCQIRHLVDAEEFVFGTEENIKELRANAWRALALLQEACEAGGCPAAPAATFD